MDKNKLKSVGVKGYHIALLLAIAGSYMGLPAKVDVKPLNPTQIKAEFRDEFKDEIKELKQTINQVNARLEESAGSEKALLERVEKFNATLAKLEGKVDLYLQLDSRTLRHKD